MLKKKTMSNLEKAFLKHFNSDELLDVRDRAIEMFHTVNDMKDFAKTERAFYVLDELWDKLNRQVALLDRLNADLTELAEALR